MYDSLFIRIVTVSQNQSHSSNILKKNVHHHLKKKLLALFLLESFFIDSKFIVCEHLVAFFLRYFIDGSLKFERRKSFSHLYASCLCFCYILS